MYKASRRQVDVLIENGVLKSERMKGCTIASARKKGNGKTYYLREDLYFLACKFLGQTDTQEYRDYEKNKRHRKFNYR